MVDIEISFDNEAAKPPAALPAEDVAREIVERVAWEIVPGLVERIIREQVKSG